MRLPSHIPTRINQNKYLWLLVIFAGIIAVFLPRTIPSTLARSQNAKPFVPAVRQLTLATKDLVYDPVTQKIYASVPGSAGAIGNSITAIDPVAGTVGVSVPIGSEPGKLAISDNSQYIYAALDGAKAVRRFDLTTQTAGIQFALGTGFSGPMSAEDISVMPGQAGTVAISRNDGGSHGGVAVYDDGVRRATSTPSSTGSNVIEFSPGPTTLYGYNNTSSEFGLRKMTVDASGVTVISTTRNLVSNFGVNIVQHNGLLYATKGQVVDPESLTRVGTFPITDSQSFVLPDSSVNRVYFLTGNFSSTLVLKAFDLTTFVQVGSLSITGVSGNPGSLIKWGTDGLAFRTSGNQVFFVSTAEIVSFPATPIPSPTQEAPGITSLSLVANDLVFDPGSQKVYASVPSSAGTFGNSIVPIAPDTGVMGTAIFIGSEPRRLAISDDAQYVYAGLDGSATVRRFETATQTGGLQFGLGNDSLTGPMSVDDIAVVPGSPNSIAVSTQGVGFSPRHQGVAIFDNAVMRPVKTPTHTGPNAIEFSSSPATLYGYNNESTAFGLYKMAVSATGVSVVSTAQSVVTGFGQDIRYDNGLLYTTSGRVVDPETSTLVGSFGVSGPVVPDTAAGRVYIINGSTLRAYDSSTFLLKGTLTIPGITGTPSGFIKCGANGLAFRTDNKVYFISLAAITPTPVTPVPTPVQVAPNIFRLPLVTNDLVYDANTQRVYASVPAAAGSFGNSIVPINPINGVMGTPVFVGSEPNRLALSTDNQVLYVGLDGSGRVSRFDLASQTPGLQFPLGRSASTGTYFVDDIATMPGSENVIAVSRRNIGITPRHEGVGIYDNGVMRSVVTSPSQLNEAIEFSASASRLYSYNNESSGFGFQKLSVDANGVVISSSTQNLVGGYNVDIKFDNGRIYSSSTVVNAESATLAGTFSPPPNPASPTAFSPESAINRAFYVSDSGPATVLKAFDTNTFSQVGTAGIPGVTGVAASLVRFGANGFAFRTSDGQVFFMRSPLVPSAVNLLVNDSGDAADLSVGDSICDTSAAAGEQCTLRAAIQETNADAATLSTIQFDASLNGGTITLGSALPDLSTTVEITGPAATPITIQRSTVGGTPSFRIFAIGSGAVATISNLNMSNGAALGGSAPSNSGGGVLNLGTLTLNSCNVSGNSAAGGGGGGVQNFNTLTVNNTVVSNNNGGGVSNGTFAVSPTATINSSVILNNTGGSGVTNNATFGAVASLAVNNTTISGNVNPSVAGGGGIFNASASFTSKANLSINNSTISGNNASSGGGGGIYNAAVFGNALTTLTITNSSILANSCSGDGGGLLHFSNGSGSTANAQITNTTIAGNNAGSSGAGGGVFTSTLSSITTTNLRNVIVAGNFRNAGGVTSDFSGAIDAASSFNLIGDGSGMLGVSDGSNGNQVGTTVAPIDPRLGPLITNGGPTQTRALLPGSPALDAGADAALTTLNGAIDNSQTVINVTDAGSIFANGAFTILVNSEQMLVLGKSFNTLTVARGVNGTTAGSHVNGENVFSAFDQRGPGFTRVVDGSDADTTDTIDIGAFEAQVSLPDLANQTINEDGSLSLPFNVGGATTSVAAISSNTALVPNDVANITVTGAGASRTLVINPILNLFGTSTITVTVSGNNSQTMTDTFVLTVNSVNDAPSFVKGADQTVNENDGTQLITNWATSISAGPIGEAGQNLNFMTTNNSNPALFSVAPTVSSSGTLVYTPATGASGTAAITITLMDDGGTSNGGVDTSSQTFHITVSDGGAFQFSSPTYSVIEGQLTISIMVTRTGGTAGEAHVNVATSAGTATANQDYISFSGTLDFADGIAAQNFSVGVLNDATDETDETVNLTLTNARGSGSLGTPASAVLTINDDDPAPALSINNISVTEGDTGTTSSKFTVSLSAPSSKTVTVNYATADDTANAGSDYQSSNGTLTFLPFETTKPISVIVNGDLSVEPDETFFVNLSNPANATINQGQGQGAILNDDASGGVISFSQSPYVVGESDGVTTITVNRTNNLSSSASVEYFTRDYIDSVTEGPCAAVNSSGVASARCDYTSVSGTLRFAAGESAKTFQILISQDSYVEGSESLSLTLTHLTGGAAFGSHPTASVTITDDATEPPANPIDSADAFVRQHYHDFLNREPDAAGLAFWSNQITECQQPGATCSAEVRRINVSAAFFLSIEFQETGYLVYRFYKSAYGNVSGTPVPLRFSEFLPDTQQLGKDVVIGQPGADQLLEDNKVAFALDFVSRLRFTTTYPTTSTPPQFVDALFANAVVIPTTVDRNAAINEFGGAGNTADVGARSRALRRVAENAALKQQESNQAFVLMQYFGYLRRNPYDPPELTRDFSGYNFWLGKLNQFNGNFVDAEMVKAFIISSEYRQRFGP